MITSYKRYNPYSFFRKSNCSFNCLAMVISIACSQGNLVRLVLEYGLKSIKCFISTDTYNFKDISGSVLSYHQQEYFQKLITMFLSYAYTLYETNVFGRTH